MADQNNRAGDGQEQRDTQHYPDRGATTPYPDPSELERLIQFLSVDPHSDPQRPAMSPAYTEGFSRTNYHDPRDQQRVQPPMVGMASPSMPQYPPPRHPAPDPMDDTQLRYSHPYADNASTPDVNRAHPDRFRAMPLHHGQTVTPRSLRVTRAVNEAGISRPSFLGRTNSRVKSTRSNVLEASSGDPSTQGATPQSFAPHPVPGMSTATTRPLTDPRPQAMMTDNGPQISLDRRLESLRRARRGQVVPDVSSTVMHGQHIEEPFPTGGSSTPVNERVVGEEWSRAREPALYDWGSSRASQYTAGNVTSENTGDATRSNVTAEDDPFTAARGRTMLQHLARLQSIREMTNNGLQGRYPEAQPLSRPARVRPPRAQIEHYTPLTPSEVSEDPECSICQNLYDEDHTAIRLQNVSCTHVFCLDCLQKWVNSGMANAHHCPSCRQSISGAVARQEPRRVAFPAEMAGTLPPGLAPELTSGRPLGGVPALTSRARAEGVTRQLGGVPRNNLHHLSTDWRFVSRGAPLALPLTPRPASPPQFGQHQSLFDPGEEESAMRRSQQAPNTRPTRTHTTLDTLFAAHAQQRAEFNSEMLRRLAEDLPLGTDEYLATSAQIGRERTAMMLRQENETTMALQSLPYAPGMPGPRPRRE
ncbi:hypothetical protein FB567DRAFT_545006 [Paraphoma chrysanthemicola]|uniref:RING-type domain-containing protein n=1 Tax=Paraphoma chrysanthemicola TaxID=798071 RepID=A0A8K0RFQ6_9PLEO|nr:hypothetical protein FB567DRAFT_545006 [Paraphoma chrysanthemicola]